MIRHSSYARRPFAKRGSVYHDALAAHIYGGVGGGAGDGGGSDTLGSLLNLAHLAGSGSGLLAPVQAIEDLHKMDENVAHSLIPGVGQHRTISRRRLLRHLLSDDPKNTYSYPWNEWLSRGGNLLGAALLGTGIGGAITRDGHGALMGALGGLGAGTAAHLLGSVSAAFTPRRSLEEQAEYENSRRRKLLQWIIPGLASYDSYKSLGAAYNLDKSQGTPDEIHARIKKVMDARRKRSR